MKAPNDEDFRAIEEEEAMNPSKRVDCGEDHVYQSRAVHRVVVGEPILADFGSMRPGLPFIEEWAMPDIYRAPEVLFGLPWSYPVDIWSVGVMVGSRKISRSVCISLIFTDS